MYRPSLKNHWSILGLGILSIVLFYFAQTSYKDVKAEHYTEKVAASKLMDSCLKTIKIEYLAKGHQFDLFDDPNQSGIIGTKLSTITTSKSVLSEKQTSVNPNLAAIFIQLLKEANVESGDYVAVGLTGSNPGMNIALYSAMKTLGVQPVIITALSSSMYGANLEDWTWLDMEAILKAKGIIPFSSEYASFGGRDDLAIGLSDSGIIALQKAMSRNGVQMIRGNSLQDNIDLRMKAYQDALPEGKHYKLFVNIGAGFANVGSSRNARLVKEGINHKLAEKPYENPGVMMLMAKKNVPSLHVLRLLRLAQKYELPIAPEPTPQVGMGSLFGSKIHNVVVAGICLFVLLAALIAVIIFDRHDRHFMANIVDPDEEL